tara:strand:+ start:1061 stop:1408 length:348 start_codon:yes stop_codon:yes gene_type:complete
MAKVQMSAKHVDDQEISSVATVATTGGLVSSPKGLVKVAATPASGILLLADGEWNGQECLLVLDSGSEDCTIKNAANDAVIKGYSSWDVSAETVVLCKWYHDGTAGYWYGLGGAA